MVEENQTEQINIRVDESVKGKWTEYVENHDEFRFVTELIRYSVEQQISESGSDGSSAGSQAVMDELNSIQSALGDIQQRGIIIDDTVGEIKREVSKSPELTELTNTVISVLPGERHSVRDRVTNAPQYPFKPGEIPRDGPQPASISEIATVVGKPEIRVKQAIEQLEKDYLIQSTEIDKTDYYYKNE